MPKADQIYHKRPGLEKAFYYAQTRRAGRCGLSCSRLSGI